MEIKDIMDLVIEKPKCCGKEMVKDDYHQNMLNTDKSEGWICLECGGFLNIVEGQLDEEELTEYKESLGIEE